MRESSTQNFQGYKNRDRTLVCRNGLVLVPVKCERPHSPGLLKTTFLCVELLFGCGLPVMRTLSFHTPETQRNPAAPRLRRCVLLACRARIQKTGL